MRRWSFLLLAAVVLASSACGSSGRDAGHDADGHDPGSIQGSVLGVSAAASDADREIKMTASDDLRFDPSSLEVSSGQTITFVIHNVGKTDHEFVLGDAAYQDAHEADMDEGHVMDSDNAVTIGPGETEELTWEFTEEGEVLFGCHEAGHYDGGMVGTIAVD